MPIKLFRETSGWIMDRAAKELEKGVFNGLPDINYFLPYTCWKEEFKDRPEKEINVSFLTHLETGPNEVSQKKKAKFLTVLEHSDHFICMNKSIQGELARIYGVSATIIRPGGTFKRPLTFGVCGKVHPTGRKGEVLVQKLVKDGYNFLAWGSGWPCKTIPGDLGLLDHFYRQIDYLVITSKIEGGPIPVIEALSLGIPVIAPDVGWCWEYPVIRYSTFGQLKGMLSSLSNLPTWESWIKEHEIFFKGLK